MVTGTRTGTYFASGKGFYKIYAMSMLQVLAIQDYKELWDSEEKVYPADNTILNPINIDEKWLKDFDFKYFHTGSWCKDLNDKSAYIAIDIKHNNGVWLNIIQEGKENTVHLPEIKYIHELQNLYFSLTGYELRVM